MLGVTFTMGHNPELETWRGKQDELSSNPILKVTRKPLRVPVHLLSVDWLHGLQLGIVHGRKKNLHSTQIYCCYLLCRTDGFQKKI